MKRFFGILVAGFLGLSGFPAIDGGLLPQILEESGRGISFEYALERKNARDTGLINIASQEIILERQLREMERDMRDANIRGNRRSHYTMGEVEVLRANHALETTERRLEINREQIRLGNEILLRNAIGEIEGLRLDVLQAGAQIDFEERSLNIARLRYDMGVESALAVRDAETSLNRARLNLESAELALADARLTLNSHLGFAPDEEIFVRMNRQAGSPLALNQRILQIGSEPSLQLLELELETARYMEFSYQDLLRFAERDRRYVYRGVMQDSTNTIELANAIEAAELAILDARDNLEIELVGQYSTLRNMLDNMEAIRADLEDAVADYEYLLVRYEAGLVTQIEIFGQLLQILTLEINLSALENNYSIALFNYNNPGL